VTGASGVPVGFAALALVYSGLAAVAFVMLRRFSRGPLEVES
jgi:hypothetical protein